MDEHELTALFHEMSGKLFSFAARRVSPHAAEDVVAQTFETVWKKRDECPTDPDARIGWVFAIGRIKILQESQRRHRKHHDNRFVADHGGRSRAVPDISDSVVESTTGHWIYQQLSNIERDLFDIAFMQDVTRAQAAAMLALSVGTFDTRVSRLRSRIRDLQRQVDSADVSVEVDGRTP